MEIKTHKKLQEIRDLPFCYFCGCNFNNDDNVTRDHVPPKAVFLPSDRKNPLILPAHYNCNQNESWADEVIGQLIYSLHGIYPEKEKTRVKIGVYEDPRSKQPITALENLNLRGFIGRCVKAFHAALYGEYLPRNTPNWFDPPPLSAIKKDNKIELEKSSIHFPLFVETIKKNRKAGRIDRIECFNGKCIYECVWEQMDNGDWACMFALNIYDWKQLGDPLLQKQRGCVGYYMPKNGLPPKAAKGIARILEIPINNFHPLDPFNN